MEERLTKGTPLQEGMWTVKDGQIYLLGSVCEDCGELYFPPKEVDVCSHCQGRKLKTVELSRQGVIESFSVVYQPPAGGFYKGEVPFIYGLIEFPEGIIIPGHVLADPENVKIGDKVEVVLDVLYSNEEETVTVYKFKKID